MVSPDGKRNTLAALFDAISDQGSDPAIIEFGAQERRETSYEQLSAQTDRFARGARAAGLGNGDTVLLLGAMRRPWIIACLGSLRAGAVPVPLDSQLSDDNLERIVKDSEASWALTDEGLAGRLRDAGFEGELRMLDAEEGDEDGWRGLVADDDDEAGDPGDAAPDDTALLFYTSGTTGPPKGVPLSQRNLAFQLETVEQAGLIEPGDRMLQPLPGHHVYPLVVGLLVPFRLGLAVVLPHAMTGPQVLRAIGEAGATVILGVPRLYAALVAGIERQLDSAGRLRAAALRGVVRLSALVRRRLGWRLGKRLLAPLHLRLGRDLRVMASGGSPLDSELAWKLEGMGWQVAIGYGLTETSPLLTINPPGNDHPESVGRPVPGIDLCIDPAAHPDRDGEGDPDAFTSEPGTEGEIVARGPGVFGGYHRLEEKTAASFTDGWFRTGDLGHFDDAGRLHVTGRRKTLIVTEAGENVQPDEIEEVLEAHDDIEDAGVLAGEEGLAAVIVPAREAAGADDLRGRIRSALSECAESLPSHHRVGDFEISREPLDRTRLGKLRRHRLEERYRELREGDGDEGVRERGPADVKDLSAEDQRLLRDERARAAWDLLVEAFPDRPVRPDANLRLDLEIDSLGWLDLTMALAARTGVDLEEERIAELESVRDLLEALAEVDEAGEVDAREPLSDPESVLGDDQKVWLSELSGPAATAASALRSLDRGIMHRLFGLEVEGAAHVPDDGPLIIAPNHLSFLDPMAVAAAVPKQTLGQLFWGGWTGVVFRNRLMRGLSRLARVVPVDPERGLVSSLAFAAAVLRSERGLVWFPEGQRSRDGELGEFRGGLAMVLQAYPEVPVVPTGIGGTFEAWPPQRRVPRLRRLSVRFGEPCTGAQLLEDGEDEEERDRITRGLREAVAALIPE